jgi:hypothetical protein
MYILPILVLILHRPEEKKHASPIRTEREIHPERFLPVLVLILLGVLVLVVLALLLRIPFCL